LVIRVVPTLNLEEFEKMGIENLLKQLLDEAASHHSSMAWTEESMHELKSVVDRSLKQIEAVEAPPPPSSSTYPSIIWEGGHGEITLDDQEVAGFGPHNDHH
jgi:hypothetical protein